MSRQRGVRPSRRTGIARPALALALASLAAGMLGGLLRAGVVLPLQADWIGQAAVWHAALMICAFLGTVIGIERAVALKHPAAIVAPLVCAVGGALLLAGQAQAAHASFVLAGLAFVAVNAAIVRRQQAAHTWLLLLGAFSWLGGNVLQVSGTGAAAVLPAWLAFLVLTIAAERLEMTRLMRRRPGAEALLLWLLGALLLGSALCASWPALGGVVFGLALAALAGWLMAFDIARRTVLAGGLARYMAVCLLAGYGWLAMGGLAWAAASAGLPAARDTALHAVGLGFVFSMVMGHAPVILPAVARVKLAFGHAFYLPLLALHGSLLLRVGGGAFDPALRRLGAALNSAAIVLFLLTVIGAALVWRRRHGALQ
ncbi:hypothetical protein [Ideonella sp. BN130291]|uniref:hypothetical protein n=1 Tax=Ideonella sp. BN130291 TaxID=3112940 RepID=UPI002E2729DF|nr:hypothetical protein [Ideonella sp. BN130291]